MPNRLAHSPSLYLRKHAENPIDWWSWTPEALTTAKEQNKPIFLSVGYSSCHWCTVMEGEAFANEAIAAYLNQYFLSIKVDREERPDLDSIYMQALQIMTGQGGWPLNIFLTPDTHIPFYGGTYFPVEPRLGRPGFLQVLQSIRRFYDEEQEHLTKVTAQMLGVLQESAQLSATESQLTVQEQLNQGLEASVRILTPSPQDYGRPRFPMMPYSSWLLQASRGHAGVAYQQARQRALDLVLGGIYDQVGGGFHRYTVDATWTVPHFEKMLYDNGQILEFLANLWSCGEHLPEIQRAIAGTIQWLGREMTAPQGYFYASQDADNFTTPEATEPEEGDFYVWAPAELANQLEEEEFIALQQAFFLSDQGNFEGKIVLQRRQGGELSPLQEKALARLFALRYGSEPENLATFPPAQNNQEAKDRAWPGRMPPVTDTKMILAWNSLMISGLARVAAVFCDNKAAKLAQGAAKFILAHQWQAGRLQRLNYDGCPQTRAQSEDYAFLIKALLDLHQSEPQNPLWLTSALKTQAEFDRLFGGNPASGYCNTGEDEPEKLLIQEFSYQDNATPSANGIALANLARLGQLTANPELLERAEQGLRAFTSLREQFPAACPSLFAALDHLQFGYCLKSSVSFLQTLQTGYWPLGNNLIATEADLPLHTVGLICQGVSCGEPAPSEGQLLAQLQKLQYWRTK